MSAHMTSYQLLRRLHTVKPRPRYDPLARLLWLVGAAIVLFAICGCAAFDAPIRQETLTSLHSPAMDAAIAAAKPGVPR